MSSLIVFSFALIRVIRGQLPILKRQNGPPFEGKGWCANVFGGSMAVGHLKALTSKCPPVAHVPRLIASKFVALLTFPRKCGDGEFPHFHWIFCFAGTGSLARPSA
jgi:hypothetical protein